MAGAVLDVFVGVDVGVEAVVTEWVVSFIWQTALDCLALLSLDLDVISVCRADHSLQAAPVAQLVHPASLSLANHLGIVVANRSFDRVAHELGCAGEDLVVGVHECDAHLIQWSSGNQRSAGFHLHGAAQRAIFSLCGALGSHVVAGSLDVDVGVALVVELEVQRHGALRCARVDYISCASFARHHVREDAILIAVGRHRDEHQGSWRRLAAACSCRQLPIRADGEGDRVGVAVAVRILDH